MEHNINPEAEEVELTLSFSEFNEVLNRVQAGNTIAQAQGLVTQQGLAEDFDEAELEYIEEVDGIDEVV